MFTYNNVQTHAYCYSQSKQLESILSLLPNYNYVGFFMPFSSSVKKIKLFGAIGTKVWPRAYLWMISTGIGSISIDSTTSSFSV